MRKYNVIVKDITDEKELVVTDYIVEVESGRIADALKFGTLEGAQELAAQDMTEGK